MSSKKKPGRIINMPQTVASQIRNRARNLELGTCYITRNWEEMREGNVLVTRRHKQGGVTFAIYLVDLALMGVKDTFYVFNMPAREYEEFIKDYLAKEDTIEIDYVLAHNIVYGALSYAESYDFDPHKDFAISQYVLEEDTEEIPLIEIECGIDGKPAIFNSDENPRQSEIRHMEKRVGKNNFQVINLGARPPFAGHSR